MDTQGLLYSQPQPLRSFGHVIVAQKPDEHCFGYLERAFAHNCAFALLSYPSLHPFLQLDWPHIENCPSRIMHKPQSDSMAPALIG